MGRSRRVIIGIVAAGTLAVAPAMVIAPADAATSYTNCKQLNADYPHGVGKSGAVDSTSGTPVTDFTVDDELYNSNTGRDRDGDSIACEKH